MRIKVVMQAYTQTAQEQYTHMFKTVEVELPDDGYEWHVAGEEWNGGIANENAR
nr:MAG TPA_asm: transcription factor/DNA Complex factor Complex Zinc finger.3A [Caudoviricetes sp.]